MDSPTRLTDYLGRRQESFFQRKEDVKQVLGTIVPHVLGSNVQGSGGQGFQASSTIPDYGTHAAQATRYTMQGFLEQCIEKLLRSGSNHQRRAKKL